MLFRSHVAFGKITQKSLRIALMLSSELLFVFSFAEKAFNQNSKRLSKQALLRLRRVSNSFFKFSKRCLPMNFSLQLSKYTQINDEHGNCLSHLASYSCQFNTGRVSRAVLRLQNGIIFPCWKDCSALLYGENKFTVSCLCHTYLLSESCQMLHNLVFVAMSNMNCPKHYSSC